MDEQTVLIIPKSQPPTQSWLYMPLIYAGLEDIEVIFPEKFSELFINVIMQTKTDLYSIDPNINMKFEKFDGFIQIIKCRLEKKQIKSRSDILQKHAEHNIMEDGYFHIRGLYQELILYGEEDDTFVYEIFLDKLVNNTIGELPGQQIIIRSRN